MNEYAFQGGIQGAHRLEILGRVFGPSSRACLVEAGLRPGMNVIEVGCGSGAMTSWLAEAVGPNGSVTAVDADPRQLEVAEHAVAARGLGNVRFVAATIPKDTLPPAAFDLAYERFVLMHVGKAAEALSVLRRALKPGGVLVCEEATSSTAFCRPPNALVAEISRLFGALGLALGVDFDLGDRLLELVSEAGGQIRSARFVQPVVPLSSVSRFLELGALEVRPLILRTQLLTESQADGLLARIRELGAAQGGYYAFARVGQVVSS